MLLDLGAIVWEGRLEALMRYYTRKEFPSTLLLVEELFEAHLGIFFHQDLVLSTDDMILETLFELIDD